MPLASDDPPNDEAYLDDAFDQALESMASGREFDLSAYARGREHLLPALADTLQLARDVTASHARLATGLHEIAGYEIERELGSGSMGVVYLARQRSLGGRPVALKVLAHNLALSPHGRGRFLAEARALGSLAHPGIVGVHDVLEADGVVAYAMDWVPGGSLAEVLTSWRSNSLQDEMELLADCIGIARAALVAPNAIAWILRSFIEMLHALGFVHAKGLLHRDIKPSNLLITTQGRLLLSDFGLVRHEDSAGWTRSGEFLGTRMYASPEQLRGDHAAMDARSDLYSVGVTLFEALTLSRPFPAASQQEAERLIAAGILAPAFRAGGRLPRDLETILGKALEPVPDRRYASAEAFAEDLERFLAFRPIQARPVGQWRRLSRLLRRNRRFLLAASYGAAGTLVAGVLIGAYSWQVPRILERERLAVEVGLASSHRYEAFVTLASAPRSAAPEQLATMLARLEQALALDPLRVFAASARLEHLRDLIGLALSSALRSADFPDRLAAVEATFPHTAALARQRFETGGFEAQTSRDLHRASPEDRYAAGMLGFLLEDSELALLGWEDRPVDAPVDVLVEGALGQTYLTLERPELAYRHLWTASRLAPSSRYLACELADCATRLGELQFAERMLAFAEELPITDTYELDARVRADILIQRGDLAAARARYADLFKRHSGPRLLANYAALLARTEDYALEVHVRLADVGHRPAIVRNYSNLLLAAERWWWHLGRPERLAVARELLDGDRTSLPPATRRYPSLPQALIQAQSDFEQLPATRPWDEPAPRSWRPPAFGRQRRVSSPTLLGLVEDLAWYEAGGIDSSSLPPAAKNALLMLLFAPLPRFARHIFAVALVHGWGAAAGLNQK